jgi:hypothetical protein
MNYGFACANREIGVPGAVHTAHIGRLIASTGISMKVRTSRERTDHSGSTFDSFLEEEGIREEVEAVAIWRVLA